MLHQNINFLALESVDFRIHTTKNAAIAVSADSTNWAKLIEALYEFYAADVASVPNLVTWLEIFQVAVVPVRVGVADNPNRFHAFLYENHPKQTYSFQRF